MFNYRPLDGNDNQLRFCRFVPRLDDSLNLDVPLNLELQHAPMDHVDFLIRLYKQRLYDEQVFFLLFAFYADRASFDHKPVSKVSG